MTTTDYLINAVLILLVVMQIRKRRMDLRTLILPIVLVGAAAAYYLKTIPTAGHDVTLDAVGVIAGAVLGGLCAATTSVWRGEDGSAFSQAGAAAAILWIVGIGSRIAFAYSSDHGGGPAIERFSRAHDITSSEAWVAALVLMSLAEVITRLIVLRIRGHRARTLAGGRRSLAAAA